MDADWSREPLYAIVDFLTADHARFRERELPSIRNLLEAGRGEGATGSSGLRSSFRAFDIFREEFLDHMREEEESVFPRILLLESLVCEPRARPLPEKVPLELLAEEPIRHAEEPSGRTMALIRELASDPRLPRSEAPLAEGLLRELDAFAVRLRRHTEIETRYLFPRAVEIEKDFNRAVGTPEASGG